MIYTVLQPTTSYSEITFLNENRDLDENHLERLFESISECYLLDMFPIVVDGDGNCIDGQHRKTTAKWGSLPLYVIRRDGLGVQDIAKANANTIAITGDHAMHAYSRLGLRQYQYAETFAQGKKFIKKGAIASHTRVLLAYGGKFGVNDFVRGEFRVTTPHFAERAYTALERFFELIPSLSFTSTHRKTILKLLCNESYDHDRMLRNVSKIAARVIPCTKESDSVEILDHVYNYGVPMGKRVILSSMIPSGYSLPTIDDEPSLVPFDAPEIGRAVVRDPTVIHVEDDLSRFVIPDWARINMMAEKHTIRLAKAINERNLLDVYPVIVDENMIVLDGGRRVAAARRLGLNSIYYIMARNVSPLAVFGANWGRQQWSMDAYQKHYIQLGYTEYERFAELRADVADVLDMRMAMQILSGQRYATEAGRLFRSGHHTNRHKQQLYKLASFLRSIDDHSIRKNNSVAMTLTRLFDKPGFDSARMVKVINKYSDEMIFSGQESCLKTMNTLYNRRLKNPVLFSI